MNRSVAEIVSDVKACLDEMGINDSEFLISEDNMDMEIIAESKIPDAMRFVNLNADISYLEPICKSEVSCKADESGMVTLTLPDDFLRLVLAKVHGWRIPVTTPIVYSDKEYAALKNRITTGYPDNPKAAYSISAEGDKVLELYTCSLSDVGNNVKVDYSYISESVDDNGEYNIPDKVYRGVVYYIAGLTLLTYKDSHADSLMNQAIQLIGAK